ncbi:MAG: diguanylate cyclase [Actinomycetota bacterium]|nr:diguanylate cyclase [Actinomycetota bacterium]
MAGNELILLADDNKLVVKVTSSILEEAGYKVDVAWDGIEAATKAYSLLPDLLILDVEMPKIKGYQVCRLLKEDPMTSWMPIIMLTGREHQSDMFWGMKTGADAYITKGFEPTHLLEKARELLFSSGESNEPKELSRKRRRDVTEDYIIDKITDLLDRKLYETTIINDIAALSGSLQDFGETIQSVFEILNKLFGYTVGGLLLLEELELYLYINRPVNENALDDVLKEILDTATGYAWEKREPQSINRILINEDRVSKECLENGTQFSYVHIPLTAHNMVFAVLLVAGPPNPAFRRDAPGILNMVCNEITMIMDNARLYEGAKRMAITDGLTRIYNHRFFQELFDREFKRADRYNTIFSFIMLDIDFFKRINDTYGHLYGDVILKEIANLIKGCLRSMDILARYGGEEFAILLPETNLDNAIRTAERIRLAVENHEFSETRGDTVKVTVSQGVTSYPSSDIEKRSDIVAKADSALYEAKEAGRNCVCFKE